MNLREPWFPNSSDAEYQSAFQRARSTASSSISSLRSDGWHRRLPCGRRAAFSSGLRMLQDNDSRPVRRDVLP